MSRREPRPASRVDEARGLFENTALTVADVARLSGLPVSTLRGRAGREGWRRPGEAAPVRIDALRARIDREIAVADAQLEAAGEAGAAGLEKTARILASLVKTLRELWKFDEERARAARAEPQDDGLEDLDAFRRELARRLDRLRAQHEAQ